MCKGRTPTEKAIRYMENNHKRIRQKITSSTGLIYTIPFNLRIHGSYREIALDLRQVSDAASRIFNLPADAQFELLYIHKKTGGLYVCSKTDCVPMYCEDCYRTEARPILRISIVREIQSDIKIC